MFQRQTDSKRLYYAYQRVWVGEELPCQSVRAKSEDPFTVVVMAGELIVGREKFPQFARCFYDKMGQFSVELLDLWLDDNVLGFLNLSSA